MAWYLVLYKVRLHGVVLSSYRVRLHGVVLTSVQGTSSWLST
jgi:hypothetical protein